MTLKHLHTGRQLQSIFTMCDLKCILLLLVCFSTRESQIEFSLSAVVPESNLYKYGILRCSFTIHCLSSLSCMHFLRSYCFMSFSCRRCHLWGCMHIALKNMYTTIIPCHERVFNSRIQWHFHITTRLFCFCSFMPAKASWSWSWVHLFVRGAKYQHLSFRLTWTHESWVSEWEKRFMFIKYSIQNMFFYVCDLIVCMRERDWRQ